MIRRKVEILKKAITECLNAGKLLSQSELTGALDVSMTRIRSALGTAETAERLLRSYITCDKDGKITDKKLKKDIDNIGIDHYVQECSQLTAENKNLRRTVEDLSERAHLEDKIIETIQASMRTVPLVKIPKFPIDPKNVNSDAELLALWSDFHGSETVNSEEMGGLNSYSTDIMIKRFQYMIDYIIHKKRKYNNIRKLNIGLLGDMVSGDIHEEIELTNDSNIIDSAFLVAAMISQGILELLPEFDEINIFGIPGNHGRLKKKPYHKRKYVNWDWVTYRIIKMGLAHYKNIKCDFPRSIFTMQNILGDNYLFLHGDNIKSWNGIPFYGINRTKAQLSDVLASKNVIFRNIFLGHFHSTGQLDKAHGEIIVSGSMKGGDEYSLGKMFSISSAKQMLMCVERGKGTTWRDPIILQDVEKDIKEVRFNRYNTV